MDNNQTQPFLDSLKRIEEWLAVLAKAQLAPILRSELADPKMSKLYQLTGKKPSRVIQQQLHLSPNTITSIWKRWSDVGLLIKQGAQYRKVL